MNTTRTPIVFRALFFAVFTLTAWLSAPLFSPNAFADNPKSKSTLNSIDEKFVKLAGQSSKDQMKITELGTMKAERTDVKDLASRLMKDWKTMNTEVAQLAEGKMVPLSAIISPQAAQKFQNLEKYSGITFDRTFVGLMESAQLSAISMFEKAEKKAMDNDIKVWFSRNLVSLRMNLDLIKDLRSKLPPEPAIDSTPPF